MNENRRHWLEMENVNFIVDVIIKLQNGNESKFWQYSNDFLLNVSEHESKLL